MASETGRGKFTGELPVEDSFTFYLGADERTEKIARNLEQFLQILVDIPIQSIKFHLERGDFEKWFRFLGESALATEVSKISKAKTYGEEIRKTIQTAVLKRVHEIKTRRSKVADYMTPNPITVASDASLPYAAKVMAIRGIGNLIVMENGKPIGLITEREILQHLVINKGEIRNVPAKVEITKSFTRITPGTTIIDAAKEMISKKARLLVFDDDNLVGIVTASDLVRAFKKGGENPPLEGTMSMRLFTMRYDDTIFNAVKTMHEKRIGSVVITKNGMPYGIFTERDLLVKVLAKDVGLNNKVGDHCASPLITTTIGVHAKEAAEIMSSNNIKRLPMTSDGKLMAMVTARDLVEAFQKV